eukprot:11164533-Alexandrium_andersonii.AAC.1
MAVIQIDLLSTGSSPSAPPGPGRLERQALRGVPLTRASQASRKEPSEELSSKASEGPSEPPRRRPSGLRPRGTCLSELPSE